ncbi:hypothetical protein KIW84_033428 [Lathyrus oleraceus]|uniref:Uncharacterized protein n=1 Tax=Pisum sativum TaxID=3888 RepID=A0A9D5AZX9_PEA|nr:hypothetical protein KIW84_033428 [Pisum sativum]
MDEEEKEVEHDGDDNVRANVEDSAGGNDIENDEDKETEGWDLFDELDELRPLIECNRGASKKLLQREEEHHVHLFVGDLDNEQFSQIKGTILNIDLLPSLHPVFNQIQREESHHTTDKEKRTKIEMSYALYSSKIEKSKWKDNSKLKCDHCRKTRHIKEKCFEIVAYPTTWESRRPQCKEKNKTRSNDANFSQATEKKKNRD